MNITKFGFEKEWFFTTKDNRFEIVTDYNIAPLLDHCGYLVEARGEAHADPLSAAYLMLVAENKMQRQMDKAGYVCICKDTMDIPKEHQRICMRKYGKNPASSYFASGKFYHSNRPRAGLHVHFGTAVTFNYTDKDGNAQEFQYAPMFNFARVIWLMDRAFKEEIKAAKRVPGEYELKPHGFEYRSLPATIDMTKVVSVCHEILKD